MSALVVGGGLAGAACATLLAQSGRAVTLIEREAAPAHKICGEFLSREAQLYLRRLGLDLDALGGHAIGRVRLVRGASVATASLGFVGIGLSRRALDEALLLHAGSSGVRLLRGRPASLTERGVVVAGEAAMAAEPLFVATGKHELRGLPRRPGRAPEHLVGFKTYFRLSPRQQSALAGHVEVMLFADGYAGLQMVEGGLANLCLLVQRERLARVGGGWPALLDDLRASQPHLATRLHGAVEMLERPLSIYRVPYGFVHRGDNSAYRLGDQMGVIASFAGDGMSIALHSAVVAAETHLAGGTPAAYHARMRRDVAAQIGRADALYRLGSSVVAQPALMALVSAWPAALRLLATLTRVPDRALRA